MVTRDDLSRAIQPGSIEYGKRQQLEAGLASAVPSPAAIGAEGGQAPGPGALPPSPDNPLASLLDGSITPPVEGPITSGLSVGPGPGPHGQVSPVSPRMARLQQVAMQARNPLVRQMARNELRRMVGEQV